MELIGAKKTDCLFRFKPKLFWQENTYQQNHSLRYDTIESIFLTKYNYLTINIFCNIAFGMSKIFVVIYSLLILIQSFNINIEGISKFNALLEHAKYHQEVYGDNFFEFISEHYGEKMASHQNKHNGHENLPFKDNHHMCSHIHTSFTMFAPITYTVYSQTITEIPIPFFYKQLFSSFENPAIFQPPKIA